MNMSEQNTRPAAAPEQELTQEQMNELFKVRRDKLSALREAGKDPFKIMRYDFTAYTVDARAEYERREAEHIAAHGAPAEGETLVDDSGGHIERGYCGIEEKLRAVGGRIERVTL